MRGIRLGHRAHRLAAGCISSSSTTATIVGLLPLYLKNHSQGEYVFDHAWADALERAGGDYYPKLQASVPFTPVTGQRLLVADRAREDAIRAALLATGADRGQGTESLVAAHHLSDRGRMAGGG